MALQVGELYGLLELDTNPFDKAMGGVKNKMSGLGGLVAGAAVGIGAALTGAFAAAGAAGVKANSDTEQFMATMEVLTGSTAKAKEEMEKLKEFAAATPFSMDDLKKGELTMRAVGVSTDKWRTSIGDTAAAFASTGKSYTDVVDAIADAQTGELERLKEFGITKNMIVEYADKEMKKTGIVNAKGQITDQEAFNDAIKGIMDSRYGGMMDKQSKTLAGMTSTFKDFMSQGLEVMSKPIFDVLKAGMERLLPAVQRLQESGAFERIGQSVANFVGAAMAGFGRLWPVIQTVGGVFKTVFSTLSSAFESVRPQIQMMADNATSNFSKIGAIVSTVMGIIGPLVRETITMITTWWRQNGTALLTNAQTVFNGILAVINFVMPVIRFVIDTVFSAIKLIIGGALQFIGGLFKTLAALINGDWSALWSGVKDMLIGAVKVILGVMSLNFVRGLLNLFRNLATGAVTGIRAMGGNLVAAFESFVNRLIANAGGMVRGVLTWFRNMFNQARTIFGMLRGFGEGIFRAMFNTLRSVAGNIYSAVRTAFSNMYNSARTSVSNLWSTVTGTFGRIKNAIVNPINTARDGVRNAVNAIKGFFTGMRLSLPKIKMPKFTIKNWSDNPVDWLKAMPTLGIAWHKDGGIFNGPTVAGLGEAGPEAIVPLSGSRMRPFAKEIARQMGGAGAGGRIMLQATLVMPDGRIIAEIAEPHIQEIQDLNSKKDKRGWGVY